MLEPADSGPCVAGVFVIVGAGIGATTTSRQTSAVKFSPKTSPYVAWNRPRFFWPGVFEIDESTVTLKVAAVAPPPTSPRPPSHVSVCPLTIGAGDPESGT